MNATMVQSDGGGGGRRRVHDRSLLIFKFLHEHLNEGFTLSQLCDRLGIQPGQTTRTAIRAARDLATEVGLHFPPAVAANGMRYMVTSKPWNALDPAMQMNLLQSGVARRRDDGLDFMRQERAKLSKEERPWVDAQLRMADAVRRASAELQAAWDDLTVIHAQLRTQQRNGNGT